MKATCSVNGVEETAKSQDRKSMNWATTAMKPAMTQKTNPLFQCAEPKSMSGALNKVTPTTEHGLSTELLDSIFWYDIKWYGENEAGQTSRHPGGRERNNGDDAIPCETCQTWIDVSDQILLSQPAKDAAKQSAGENFYDFEHQRTTALTKKNIQAEIDKRKTWAREFAKWPIIINNDENPSPKCNSAMDENMIEMVGADRYLFNELQKVDIGLLTYLRERIPITTKSRAACNQRNEKTKKMVEEWNGALSLIRDLIAEENSEI